MGLPAEPGQNEADDALTRVKPVPFLGDGIAGNGAAQGTVIVARILHHLDRHTGLA